MYRLVATYNDRLWAIEIFEGAARLGSSPDNDLVLPVRGVSRHHALVQKSVGGIEVVDQHSKNGILVGGRKVERAFLTPGLRAQVGAAWIEFQEVSSTADEPASVLLPPESSEDSRLTDPAGPATDPQNPSSADSALRLVNYLLLTGRGEPGERGELLAQLRSTLGAEALVSFGWRRSRGVVITEGDGQLLAAETELLRTAMGRPRDWPSSEVRVRRSGAILLAGRDRSFLAARFNEETLARETWRWDLLRVAALMFFAPVRALKNLELEALRHALELTFGNKKKAAELLGVSRTTVHHWVLGDDVPTK